MQRNQCRQYEGNHVIRRPQRLEDRSASPEPWIVMIFRLCKRRYLYLVKLVNTDDATGVQLNLPPRGMG